MPTDSEGINPKGVKKPPFTGRPSHVSKLAVLVFVSLTASSTSADQMKDESLYGVWRPVIYSYGGTDFPIDDALMIITPNYLIANAIYNLSKDKGQTQPDANVNFGTYKITGPGKLVVDQMMQLHWRAEADDRTLVEGDGTFFNRGVREEIHYKVEGDRLTFYFQVPGEQSWVMERLPQERF